MCGRGRKLHFLGWPAVVIVLGLDKAIKNVKYLGTAKYFPLWSTVAVVLGLCKATIDVKEPESAKVPNSSLALGLQVEAVPGEFCLKPHVKS